MNRIIFPLEAGGQGPQVADLQDALQLLLDRGVILPDDEGARRELSARLQSERAERIYDGTTSELVLRSSNTADKGAPPVPGRFRLPAPHLRTGFPV